MPGDLLTENTNLSRKLQTALFTPVGLLLLVAIVLGAQLARTAEHADAVKRSSDFLGEVYDVQRQIIDQETAVRGFMLTRDQAFLEPYRRARVKEAFDALAASVADDPIRRHGLAEARSAYRAWHARTVAVVSGEEVTPHAMASMRARKTNMDAVRRTFAALIAKERSELRARSADAAASRTTTMFLFASLFTAVAISLVVISRRQIGDIARTYETALAGERAARAATETDAYIREGQAKLSEQIVGEIALEELAQRGLAAIAEHVGADVGAFFVGVPEGWELWAGYGIPKRAKETARFAEGEGLVGRAASTRKSIHVQDVPEGLLTVRSGTLEVQPKHVFVLPAEVDGVVRAVLELGFLSPIAERDIALLERVGESLAIGVRSSHQVTRLKQLLESTRMQAEELQTQQEELRVANEELVERDRTLSEAQALLEERHEELMVNNARLEEQTESLEAARKDIAEKAAEVVRASQYKSEFLANMSHELRTPLNSSLILAKLLADNKHGNLTPEQVKFAQTIYAAGNDLLSLINDVLDLSKIEAGRTDVNPEPVSIERATDHLHRLFEPLANDKGLTLEVRVEDGTPTAIETDAGKLDQILKNLLSNALKFTEKGRVAMHVSARAGVVAFAVSDSGIGIAEDQREMIFEAFRQVDSASNRKYGGTGLGLSISRDLARLLGGDVAVSSEPGRGSVFTLTLPLRYAGQATRPKSGVQNVVDLERARSRAVASAHAESFPSEIEDDRARLDRGKRSVLVVEDDVAFAEVLVGVARELGFQTIVAHSADAGVALARRHSPSAVILDMKLPDHSGLSVLDRLKRDPKTRHIPVHGVSVQDYTRTALAMGAVGYVLKPARREQLLEIFERIGDRLDRALRRVLVVEDDEVQRESIEQLLRGPGVEIVAVGTVAGALEALRASTFDCVVTDLSLPDASGFDLLEKMGEGDASSFPPIIVYTGRSLTAHDEQRLLKHSSSIIVKDVRSPERLLDEVTLFLHHVESELPPEKQRMLRTVRDRDARFEGKTILVVEDDVRNIFALSSILEPKGARVVIARNGREALEALEANADVALVLMDIMMPEMDGLEATRRIRQRSRWAKVPIIALTAKAMKDDHERCIEAGANDYVSKPFDADMLTSLIGIWMPR